ncbi:vacuolar protein sorting-associated protein 8 homolog [Panonychus citri]|uniref:vacuolar protein sorting-associated protein 8 homolog n=1 Tax=Panonychus citri TaxID=50023 RepID=UPI002306F198|nr:vacuolar protein sorting-associated protein 8 homolog [Panonychus citri]
MIAADQINSSVDGSLDNDLGYLDHSSTSQVTQSPSRSIISQDSNLPPDDIIDIQNGNSGQDTDTDSETVKDLDDCSNNKGKGENLDQDDTIKVTTLRSISSQLRAAYVQKTDAGVATCLTVSQVYIAVGTAHGVVFCFDKQQVMRWCLRKEGLTDSVTSIAIRYDSTRLVTGYSKGSLGLWSLENGQIISLFSGQDVNYATPLLLKFTSEPDLMVFSNTGGSVFQVWVRKRSKSLEPICIFSGSRGEVLHFDTLTIPTSLQHRFSFLNNLCLISLATVTKIIVISLLPSPNVHFYHPLEADPKSPPIINWKFVSIQTNTNDRVLDPVLAFGRGQIFSIYQVSVKNGRELSFIFLRRFNLSYTLINMFWFTSKIIATLDKYFRLHVIDIKSGNEISNIDISPVDLTFSTQFFTGFHIDGQVSGAMAAAGTQACYNSTIVTSSNSSLSHISVNQLLLLGRELMVMYSLRPWDSRIDWFISEENYSQALNLSLSIYKGEAESIIGLIGSRNERKSTIADKIISLIDEYLNYLINPSLPFNYTIPIGYKSLSSSISSTIQAALSIDRPNILWEIIYERCKHNTVTSQIYLDSLKGHIIKGSLNSIPPVIAKDLVNLYEKRKSFNSLESLIICLKIDCLDIHQVTTICRSHNLHRGLIYIYNEAFNDYTTPLELLLKLISSKLLNNEILTKDDIDLGNTILLYISCCLTGRKFHGGSDIPESLSTQVRQETIKLLIRFKNPPDSDNHDNGILDCTFYPNLKALLLFDGKDFLNVLALAMDKDEFDGVEGLTLTEVLIHVMMESCGFTSTQIASLFIFLARMIAKPRSYIKMSDELVNQIVESLTETSDQSDIEERQQALMQLVTSDKVNSLMIDRILISAEKAKFFQVCEYIYWQRKQYPQLLTCYLSDQFLKNQVFTLIERVMCLNEEKIQFLKCIWNNIGKLIEINSSLSTKLLLDYFIPTNDLENLLNSLESKPLDLMRVLKCLIDCDQSTNWSVKDSPLISKCSILFEPWIHERYIELLCKYEPDEAARFLQSTSTYRPKVALQICTKSDNQQAKAILYEKEDKFTEALDLLLDKLDKDLILINNDETSDQLKDEQLFKKLFSQFENLIQFAQRCSEKLDNPENREFLWYPLLQRVTSFHEITDKLYPESRSFSIDLCNNMFNNMMGYISMLTLLTWILESSITDSESIGQFSKIRYLLTAMLDAYNYEASLLTAYNDTIKSELYRSLSNYVYLSKKGFIIKSNSKCGLCNGNCNSSSESLIIFQCHSYHVDCLSIDNRNLGCPLCNQNSSLIKLKCNDDDGSGSKINLTTTRIQLMKNNNNN